MRRWASWAMGALLVAAGSGWAAGGGAALASGCVAKPGSTACLSGVWKDGGASFNATAWAAVISKAETPDQKLLKHFEALAKNAKTNAEIAKLNAEYAKATAKESAAAYGHPPTGAVFVKDCHARGATIHTCQALYPMFDVLTGWQLTQVALGGGGGEVDISTEAEGPTPGGSNDAHTLMTVAGIPDHPSAAWFAMDSPLPLIAMYEQFHTVALTYSHARHQVLPTVLQQHAGGFLASADGYLWPTTFAPELLKVMKAAGMNPVMWGGPDIPPGSRAPAWTAYYMNHRDEAHGGWSPVPDIAACPQAAYACPTWTFKILSPA